MNDSLGFRIRLTRMKRDISQRKLAELIGVSKTTMNEIEQNTSDLRASNLKKIADVLNVSMDYLAGRTNEAA